MKLLKLIPLFAMIIGFAFQSNAQIVVKKPRRPAVIIKKPNAPKKNHVWVAGHWKWDGNKYVWVKGHWKKTKPGHVWVAGHWAKVKTGYKWVPGHWAPARKKAVRRRR